MVKRLIRATFAALAAVGAINTTAALSMPIGAVANASGDYVDGGIDVNGDGAIDAAVFHPDGNLARALSFGEVNTFLGYPTFTAAYFAHGINDDGWAIGTRCGGDWTIPNTAVCSGSGPRIWEPSGAVFDLDRFDSRINPHAPDLPLLVETLTNDSVGLTIDNALNACFRGSAGLVGFNLITAQEQSGCNFAGDPPALRVPEPATLQLLAALLGLAVITRIDRRRRW